MWSMTDPCFFSSGQVGRPLTVRAATGHGPASRAEQSRGQTRTRHAVVPGSPKPAHEPGCGGSVHRATGARQDHLHPGAGGPTAQPSVAGAAPLRLLPAWGGRGHCQGNGLLLGEDEDTVRVTDYY